MVIIAKGVIVTTVTGWLWWKTTAVSFLWGGPIGIAAGLASLVIGLYIFAHRTSPKKRAITALDVMREGIKKWAAGGSEG